MRRKTRTLFGWVRMTLTKAFSGKDTNNVGCRMLLSKDFSGAKVTGERRRRRPEFARLSVSHFVRPNLGPRLRMELSLTHGFGGDGKGDGDGDSELRKILFYNMRTCACR